ncbi:spatacsin isoform X2 [Pungitius pungitius]|uniref:spatacsin isoform X2 n=1 Tax=Pungitius pungitius TaxID=134920 RepID=UPI002E0DA3E3
MLEAAPAPEGSSIEVCVIPQNQHSGPVADIQRAEMAPGGSLLGSLGAGGRLKVWDPADRDAPPATLDGCYADFSWEGEESEDDVIGRGMRPVVRLLAVGAQWDLQLVEVEAETSVTAVCVSQCPSGRLLQTVREQDDGVCELHSLHLLSFAAGCACVLLNSDWLLRLRWLQTEEQPQTLSCCSIQQSEDSRLSAVHRSVCRDTLFSLSCSGLISVHHVTDGSLLASIHLPAYLRSLQTEDDLVSSSCSSSFSSSTFCLLQVSADLTTAVAVCQSHSAVAIDLDHYFSLYPDQLLCAPPPSRPPLRHPADQDGVPSSERSLAALGSTFSADRSWEARLASMSSRAQRSAEDSSSSSSSSWSSWSSALLHLGPRGASPRSGVPRGGASVCFPVAPPCSPSLLSVSQFSAQLTFVAPGNQQPTVALWDFLSGSVRLHRAEGEAAPVRRRGDGADRLLLREAGVFQLLFSVSQQDLLSRLMLFGSAATVDAVCHLNSWGRCSIPVHALQAGLKNRQLDTVDFYLKSKENILVPAASTRSLTARFQELCPALDLLCSAVSDSHIEAQSRQFSEQLLNVTMSFINAQTRSVLTNAQLEDEGVGGVVEALDRYVTELRGYMKKFPWPAGGDTSSPTDRAQGGALRDEWAELPTEEVVRQAVLTNQIPRAQALLRGRGQPERRLSVLRAEGLRQTFRCLQLRDLQTADALLLNMGFSVKEQLHSICVYTADQDLREFLVEVLSGRSCFPEEEMRGVEFIREMARMGSLPAARCPADATPHRLLPLQMVRREEVGAGEEVLEELVAQRRREEDRAGLWTNLRLDWVRNWDPSCRTSVLLSRRPPAEVTSCHPAVLWRYLTALHDQRQVVDWIQNQENSGGSWWPELTPELVNDNTACSSYMREQVLDLLARGGVFLPEELADLEQLLWRLAQGGGVMATPPPLPQHRSPLGLDLHGLFVSFCVDHGLKYLLYAYLERHRLTPRNCPLLTNRSLSESRPWFEMLVKIQEITRDLSDPALVFQASLTSAQVLLPGSQPSLSSLLLEGHSLLALAAIMFSPGGIDQVVAGGEILGKSERTVDPQLLKMALAPHPKLRAVLFPAGPRGSGPSSDISVYHLLQSLHPLDPTRLFGWQSANTLNSTETSELPHFSSPPLVGRFALVENLDFLYYLRHGRPSFAFATFLVRQLAGCTDATSLLQQAAQQAYRLALRSFDVPSVTSAAVCFCELMGVCSLKVRVDVEAMNRILQHWSQQYTQEGHTLVSKGVKLAEAEPGVAEELIGYLEAAVTDSLEQKNISRSSYEAAQLWALPVQFCQLHGLQLSSVYPAHCADDGQFIHFLLFVQLHSFPPSQVRSLAARFGPALKTHLRLAFQDLQLSSRGRRPCDSEEQPLSPKAEEPPRELFRVLLQSQEEVAPSRYLLQEALVQRCPTLAVMAACQQGAEPLQSLCVWLLTSVGSAAAAEATAHLAEAPQHHQWTLHDLSIIWRTLLGRGHVRPLLRGFQLFQRDCPLVLVLRMFELCCDYKNFSEAKAKLLDFQRTLVTLRNGGGAPPGAPPLQWVECQASVLLLSMLQRCTSQFDLHRLLLLLADVDKLLKSHGPDFRRLSQLSTLLQGSEVNLSPRLLQCSSPSVQQEEFQAAVDALQGAGRYEQARQVALLGGLPVHHLLLSQLLQEVNSQKSKQQWGRLETRLGRWRRCHELLKAEGADPESTSGFFLSQANPPAPRAELPDLQERCVLLGLAAHWLAAGGPAARDRLEVLEKKMWICRVQRGVLAAAMETASVFDLPPPAATPETSAYEELMKEFSFSGIPGLNTEACLSLEGLPGQERSADPALGPEERAALDALVGQLLDEGRIHEASRVCRYFSLHHRDLWLVLRCRGLASGELDPEPQEEASEVLPKKSIPSSASMSSLSSFVVLPLPEDQVALQLQKLVDQCRHGKSYCKQVLSLYLLSKELQCSFGEVCREEPRSVLEKLLLSEQPERFRKARAFIRAQGLSADCVAQLVCSAVVQALLASAQDLQPERRVYRPSDGRHALIQLVKLCDDPNLVGVQLLEKLNTVPLRDLNCIVELLVVAHDCFSLTCNMEGIVRVLQSARHLSHAYLAPGEHYSLLVRLLTGIGRYNEMTYVFDLLHQNHRFEMLLRKKMDTDRGQSSSLKTALLDYIKRCLPADSEKHNMVALCFSMRREIGENHEMAARTQLKIIESQAWVVSPDLKSSLVKVLGLLRDAAESFAKDSCVRQASRCVRTAKLVALQLHLLNRGSDLRVVNLRAAELLSAVTALPRCYQVFVVSEAYSYSPDWAEVLYQKVILNGDFVYLEELKRHRPLTSGLFEDIFKKLDGAPSSAGANVRRLLPHCEDVYGRYRLAYQHGLYDVTKALLQDAKTSGYLSDKLAG